MKNIILGIMLVFFARTVNVYAVELSFGLSGSYMSLNLLRGDDAERYIDRLKYLGMRDMAFFQFFNAAQLDIMLELTPFLALETGVGYGVSTIKIEGKIYPENLSYPINRRALFRREEITVPIMLRLQIETSYSLLYGSAGVKFGIPLSETYHSIRSSTFISDINEVVLDSSEYAMDIAFALGSETRITGANYIGMRMGYDLNLIKPFQSVAIDDDADFYHDDLSFIITYRYAFNSKWNKQNSSNNYNNESI